MYSAIITRQVTSCSCPCHFGLITGAGDLPFSACSQLVPKVVIGMQVARDQWRRAPPQLPGAGLSVSWGRFHGLGTRRAAHALPPRSSMASSTGSSGGNQCLGPGIIPVAETPTSGTESTVQRDRLGDTKG